MNSLISDSIAHLVTQCQIEWTQQVVTYQTNAGKAKPCLHGIPGKTFWRHWKAGPDLKARLRVAGGWLARVEKGKWELWLPINRQSRDSIAQAIPWTLEAFSTAVASVPDAVDQDAQIAASQPYAKGDEPF